MSDITHRGWIIAPATIGYDIQHPDFDRENELDWRHGHTDTIEAARIEIDRLLTEDAEWTEAVSILKEGYTPKPPAGGDAGAVEVDWDRPLEAVHRDGRVVPVTADPGHDYVEIYIRSDRADFAEGYHNGDGTSSQDDGWTVRNSRAALALPAPVVEGDAETVAGRVGWHTSEEGGGPDVGISVGLGNGSALWIGELLDRDGGPVGIVFHGPAGARHAARLTELDEVRDLFEHHVAPAIAALSEGRADA